MDEYSGASSPPSGEGFVYVLTNPAMRNLVKIGSTDRHPARRARELSNSTGVPNPFELAAYFEVEDLRAAEAAVHRGLAHMRQNTSREFFRIGMPRASWVVSRLLRAFRSESARWIAAGECPSCRLDLADPRPREIGVWDGDMLHDPPGGKMFGFDCPGCRAPLTAVGGVLPDVVWSVDLDALWARVEAAKNEAREWKEKAADWKRRFYRGRCPSCAEPILSVQKSVVIDASGRRSQLSRCPACSIPVVARTGSGDPLDTYEWVRR